MRQGKDCPLFLPFARGAGHAPILVSGAHTAMHTQLDDGATRGAECGFIRGRVWHLLEIVLVGSIPDDHLGLELCAAFFAGLPVSFVPLIEVKRAEGVALVVPTTAFGGVRERDVLVQIVTDPIAAAFGLDQILGFAAQPAARFIRFFLGWG